MTTRSAVPAWVQRAAIALIALCLGGCATATQTAGANAPSRPLFVFPTREEIGKFAQLPAPTKLLAEPLARVDDWRFTEPAAEAMEEVPYEERSPWGRELSALAQAQPQALVLSRGLRCQAAELAAFFQEKGTAAPAGLRRFIAARCGSLFQAPRAMVGRLQIPTTADDAALWAAARERVLAWVGALPPGRHHLGLAVRRGGPRATLVLLAAQPSVTLDPLPLTVPDDGAFVVSGTLLSPATFIQGITNAGRFRVNHCQRERAVALPRFVLRCQLAPGDSMAWTQVAALPPEHLLLDGVLTLLMRRAGADLGGYATRPADSAGRATVAASDLGDVRTRMLGAINEVRRAARLPLMQLAERESQTVTALAPQLLTMNEEERDVKILNRITLGLLAGWDIGGSVRSGDLGFQLIAPSDDVDEWMEQVLQQPHLRTVLLKPDASQVAIGPLLSAEPRAIGAVVTTFALFNGTEHRADTDAAMEQLHQERLGRRLAPPVFINELNALMAAEAKPVASGSSPEFALRTMLERVASRGFSVRGTVIQTTSLERLTFPEEALRGDRVRVGLTVTHHQALGSPWGHYVVYLLLLQDNAPEA